MYKFITVRILILFKDNVKFAVFAEFPTISNIKFEYLALCPSILLLNQLFCLLESFAHGNSVENVPVEVLSKGNLNLIQNLVVGSDRNHVFCPDSSKNFIGKLLTLTGCQNYQFQMEQCLRCHQFKFCLRD